MSQLRSHGFVGALIVVSLLLVFAHEMRGDVPSLNGKGKIAKEFQFGFSMTGSSDDLLEIPDNRVFVVTDFQVTNLSSTVARVGITRGSVLAAVTPFFPVAQDETFQYSYQVGPEIPGGDTLSIFDVGGGSVTYFISGYLRK